MKRPRSDPSDHSLGNAPQAPFHLRWRRLGRHGPFRVKSSTRSDPNRPPVPTQIVHRFRSKPSPRRQRSGARTPRRPIGVAFRSLELPRRESWGRETVVGQSEAVRAQGQGNPQASLRGGTHQPADRPEPLGVPLDGQRPSGPVPGRRARLAASRGPSSSTTPGRRFP